MIDFLKKLMNYVGYINYCKGGCTPKLNSIEKHWNPPSQNYTNPVRSVGDEIVWEDWWRRGVRLQQLPKLKTELSVDGVCDINS